MKLDKNWELKADSYSWVLKFTREEEVDEKVKEGKKYVKTGKRVVKEITNSWYYGTLKQCFMKYLNESTKECSSIQGLTEKIDHIEQLSEKFPKMFVVGGKVTKL